MNYRRVINTPLYRQVASAIQADLISPGEEGSPLPTEPELARLYRVSVTTVRKAMDLLEQKGQVKRRQGSGVYILRSKVVRRVGVYIDHNILAADAPPIINSVFTNFHLHAAGKGLELVSFFGNRDYASEPTKKGVPDALVLALKQRSIDGLVAIGSLPFEYWVEMGDRHGVPVVGSTYGFSSSVRWDQEKFLQLALETALLNGKRKVAFIIGSRTDMRLYRHCEKLEDVADALSSQYGVVTYKEWIRSDYSICLPGAGWELFRDLWGARSEKPDCVIVSDFILSDVVDAAVSMEIAPLKDLLLITSSPQKHETRVPYPVVRIETSNESVMAKSLLEEIIRRMEGEKPRHLLIAPTGIHFDQRIYSQIPSLSSIGPDASFQPPLLPDAVGESAVVSVEEEADAV
ncbi:MAG TPA: GntR family transcriptional regulator [Chthoniobacteraceae bacterium]|nr:GntR family transcriptional regulator [Chthoniobacteraceae bacterium]